MVKVNVHEAKTHLSRLLARVVEGEEVVIAKDGQPVARLVPFISPAGDRLVGKGKGDFEIGADFDEPLPDEVVPGGKQ
jgi:prevent-host-death family protein